MKNIILPNGVRCIVNPMRNTHSVTVGLYLKAGVGYGEDKPGITHLLEHLHFRQLGKTSQSELYYRMEKIGSTLRAVTYRDLLHFSMKVAPSHIEECLGIFTEILNAKSWTNENFCSEKQVVQNQIIESENYTSIEKSARRCIFKDHPLACDIMGTTLQVEDIVLQDIVDYKNKVFCTSNILICMTGNFTNQQELRMLKMFSEYEALPIYEEFKLVYPTCFHSRKPDIILEHTDNGNQLDVNISFDIKYSSANVLYLRLLNCILGEGVGSRLQRSIREEKHYCAGIGSYVEWYAGFAVLHISFAVDNKVFYPCLNDIVDIINLMKTDITKEDMDTALPFYTTNQIFYEDDTEAMNYQLAYQQLIFGQSSAKSNPQNNKETIDAIQTIATDIFVPANCCVVVIGNTRRLTKKRIREIIQGRFETTEKVGF